MSNQLKRSYLETGEGTGRHVPLGSSMGGFFFALTGALIATSVFNFSSSGIPLFYLVFLVPVIALAFPNGRRDEYGPVSRSPLVMVGVVGVTLLATTFLHLITINRGTPGSEFLHLVSRLCFLAYFVVAQKYLQGELVSKTLVWLRRLLILICAYGAYQVPAKLLGLPLFLDWLRNNRSFFLYDYDMAGWIGLVRATSIYAEPSQATIPLLVLFMLNLCINNGRWSTLVGWTTLVLFAIATFSRGAWISVLVAAGVFLLFRSQRFTRLVPKKRSTVLAGALILLVTLPVWGFLRPPTYEDLSAEERSASIILGLNMIKDAPVLGFGWNSFGDVIQHYTRVPIDVSEYVSFEFIHNMTVSYVQQAGLSGLLLAALPFILIAGWSTAPPWMTYVTLASFLIAAEFGDIGYASLTWLWLALLVNMRFAEMTPQAKRKSFITSRLHYRRHMSVPPPLPS